MLGAKNELEQAKIIIQKKWQIEAPYSLEKAKRAGIKLLKNTKVPTAILCGNDIIAQGVIYAAKQLGINVPNNLSVMGIGDFNGSAEIEPSLSTVHIPATQIGFLAAEHMFKAIVEKQSEVNTIRCDLRVITRNSTTAAT